MVDWFIKLGEGFERFSEVLVVELVLYYWY